MLWFTQTAELDEEFANQAKVSTRSGNFIGIIQLIMSFHRFTASHHAARHWCVHSLRVCRVRHYFTAGWWNFDGQEVMEWLHTIPQ